MWLLEGRVVQAEATAGAKALRLECVCHIQEQQGGRVAGVELSEGESGR